jgi:WD40 repeat protein
LYSTIRGQFLLNLSHDAIIAICSHPTNDKQLLSASSNGTIKLWNIINGKELGNYQVGYEISHFALVAQDDLNASRLNGYIGLKKSGLLSFARICIDTHNSSISLQNIQNLSNMTFYDMKMAASQSILLLAAINQLTVMRTENNRDIIKKITHNHNITCIAYNRERNLIAFGDKRGAIKLYHPSGAQSLMHWHPVTCNDLEFSADGNYLYSVAEDGVMCMWNTSKGSREQQFPHGANPLLYIAVSSKQDNCLVVTADNQVVKIDLHGNVDRFNIQGIIGKRGRADIALHIAVDPKNGEILLNGSNVLQWFDVDNEKETKRKHIQYKALSYNPSRYNKTKPINHIITHIALNHNGTYIVDCEKIDEQNCLKIWNNTGNACDLITIVDAPHGADITSCSFNKSAQFPHMCVTTSLDGVAKLWDKANDTNFHICYAIIHFQRLKPYYASFSLDGYVVAIAFEHILTLWDARTATLLQTEDFTDGNIIYSVHFIDDEHIVAQTQKHIYIYSLVAMKQVWSVSMRHRIEHFDVHQASRQIALNLAGKCQVHLFNIPSDLSKTTYEKIKLSIPIRLLGFSSKGRLLLFSDDFDIYTPEISAIKQDKPERIEKIDVMEIEQEPLKPMQNKRIDTDKWSKTIDEIETASFDPNQGLNAWKDIFGGHSSHQLMSMNDCFNIYMDAFLLKSEDYKKKQENVSNNKDATNTQNGTDWFKGSNHFIQDQTEKKRDMMENELSHEMISILQRFARNSL